MGERALVLDIQPGHSVNNGLKTQDWRLLRSPLLA